MVYGCSSKPLVSPRQCKWFPLWLSSVVGGLARSLIPGDCAGARAGTSQAAAAIQGHTAISGFVQENVPERRSQLPQELKASGEGGEKRCGPRKRVQKCRYLLESVVGWLFCSHHNCLCPVAVQAPEWLKQRSLHGCVRVKLEEILHCGIVEETCTRVRGWADPTATSLCPFCAFLLKEVPRREERPGGSVWFPSSEGPKAKGEESCTSPQPESQFWWPSSSSLLHRDNPAQLHPMGPAKRFSPMQLWD